MEDDNGTLARSLEALTAEAIAALRAVLRLPVDADNGAVLRAITAAAGIGLNAQLRADAMRLRALREDKAIAALLEVIRSQEGKVPAWPASDAARVVKRDTVSADTVPFLAG